MSTTWRIEFDQARKDAGDASAVVALAPNGEAFDVEFDEDYGGPEGAPVLAWTEDRVYFPVVYDGAEWMGSAPRNPTTDGQRHVGGW